MELILASNSPRRREILTENGYTFKVIPSSYEETERIIDPIELAKAYSFNKAKDVFDKVLDKKNSVVLGSDTVVVLDGKVLGKPKDEAEAFEMLKSLSNKTHQVISGYAILSQKFSLVDQDITEVTFNKLSDELINDYIKNKKPLDKAGAYGIQDGYPLVKAYKGSYNNIVGLPIEKISKVLNGLFNIGEENG
jgi:septum formation protein